ncbi:MAG: DUF952 domain-containing protein [Chloroflexi bacterium]|nr:DUF952 domain-containing protein [Chloroflexota bacterium]
MIPHICSRADWAAARDRGFYAPESLDRVGFVHCSDPGTVHLPAATFHAGRTDLVLLEVDPGRLDAELRWEPSNRSDPSAPWFPHIYGPIPIGAIVGVHDFPPLPDGRFELPPALARRGRGSSGLN